MAREYLTYPQVADRIEAALGVRPALSTLRAAAAVSSRGTTRTRLTAGMPGPVGRQGDSGPALFELTAIDRWLARHPRRQLRRLQERLIAAPLARRPQAVARALHAGLSWQEIADALGEADGTTYSRQRVHFRYR